MAREGGSDGAGLRLEGALRHLRSAMMAYDAVLCDIDGCLSPETSAPMDAHTLTRIGDLNRAAIAQGRGGLALCSGRPQPFVEAMARLLGCQLPCIAENGVWLYDPRTNGYDRDPAISAAHLAMVREASAWVESQLGPKGVVIQPGKSASISLYHPDAAYLRGIEGMVRTAFAACGWSFRISMTWFYINCDLAHISKGTGIERWCRVTGLSRERLAGIGDTPSDLAIAERVAFFACPANAHEEVKGRAAFIAGAAEAPGVLEVLNQVMPIQ